MIVVILIRLVGLKAATASSRIETLPMFVRSPPVWHVVVFRVPLHAQDAAVKLDGPITCAYRIDAIDAARENQRCGTTSASRIERKRWSMESDDFKAALEGPRSLAPPSAKLLTTARDPSDRAPELLHHLTRISRACSAERDRASVRFDPIPREGAENLPQRIRR
jgi:hypothetical protein